MSVKRYECGMTNAPTEYQSPTMHQDANGGYVSYEDYAALEARCSALAAENAGLKELIEQHANSVAVCPNCSHEEPSETDDIVALYRSMETPATNAFLAEVREQGKIEGAESALQIVFAGGSVQACRVYISQLRKGV